MYIQRPVPPWQEQKIKQSKVKATISKEAFAALVNEKLLSIKNRRKVLKQRIWEKEKKRGKQDCDIMVSY